MQDLSWKHAWQAGEPTGFEITIEERHGDRSPKMEWRNCDHHRLR